MPNESACQWFVDNWQFASVKRLHLAKKLCVQGQHGSDQIYNILQISRVVAIEICYFDEFIEEAMFLLNNEGASVPDNVGEIED